MANIERGKELVRRLFVDGMAEGRTEVVDECLAPNAVDDAHPTEGEARGHLRDVVRGLHLAFPDLTAQITHLVGEGDTVACRVVLRGTHAGPLHMPGMPAPVAATGRSVEFEQFHVVTVDDEGRGVHHWGVDGGGPVIRELTAAAAAAAAR